MLHLLPTLWFRNTWIWGCRHEGCTLKPVMEKAGPSTLRTDHETLGKFVFTFGPDPSGNQPEILVTENETNTLRLFGTPNYTPYTKDAFHEYVVKGNRTAVNRSGRGTKAASHYVLRIAGGGQTQIRMRLSAEGQGVREPLEGFEETFATRIAEADAFYRKIIPADLGPQALRRAPGVRGAPVEQAVLSLHR